MARPTQYGEPKVQVTVRMPASVIAWLKEKYDGKLQTAIDILVIDVVLNAQKRERDFELMIMGNVDDK